VLVFGVFIFGFIFFHFSATCFVIVWNHLKKKKGKKFKPILSFAVLTRKKNKNKKIFSFSFF